MGFKLLKILDILAGLCPSLIHEANSLQLFLVPHRYPHRSPLSSSSLLNLLPISGPPLTKLQLLVLSFCRSTRRTAVTAQHGRGRAERADGGAGLVVLTGVLGVGPENARIGTRF